MFFFLFSGIEGPDAPSGSPAIWYASNNYKDPMDQLPWEACIEKILKTNGFQHCIILRILYWIFIRLQYPAMQNQNIDFQKTKICWFFVLCVFFLAVLSINCCFWSAWDLHNSLHSSDSHQLPCKAGVAVGTCSNRSLGSCSKDHIMWPMLMHLHQRVHLKWMIPPHLCWFMLMHLHQHQQGFLLLFASTGSIACRIWKNLQHHAQWWNVPH